MAIAIRLTVNGKPVDAQVEPHTLLVQFLREQLRLTGTHVGCDTAQCGACTVHLDGRAVKACNMLALQADGARVTTIEGLAEGADSGHLHPMQEAFRECHGLQCGFCTPGFLMTLDLLFRERPEASAEEIREVLSGHLCRCTGYAPIMKAALAAQKRLRGNSNSNIQENTRGKAHA